MNSFRNALFDFALEILLRDLSREKAKSKGKQTKDMKTMIDETINDFMRKQK